MTDDPANYLRALAKHQGVACGTVKDGHVLVFKRDYLRKLVERPGGETLVILVKRPEMGSRLSPHARGR